MTTVALAGELFSNIREFTLDVLDGLPDQALTWRPDPDGNTIAWLVWHLARVQDDHVAGLADGEQVWAAPGWTERFGLDTDDDRIGYGDSSDDVAALAPEDPSVLGDYLDAVTDRTLDWLAGADGDDWDRIVDRNWDPPVTARVRLASIISDDLQHVGQAAYLRGMYERLGAHRRPPSDT
ncbi:uncharacterized protein DUF664 [Ilumatobacter fluminis]|uniref:Uncharacterized protein DUF664 n=1 Tax=Ilumatobacter fluminis TaxID=467091 RepID=A0A4R7I5Q0_9ACTN|nr:DinB family protein [Ilumatobacter fluminis]TDT18700.1 uncharacterized protein DUF664 [Ilumatobacter fluminis]